jgi:hypothetical protein
MARVETRIFKGTPRKLTPAQVEFVKTSPLSGYRLAKNLGVSSNTIWKIRHGLSYKHWLLATYVARVTDGRERYSLGSFASPEAAQAAIDRFNRTNKWPRGSIEMAKGRFRARLSLGVYDTRHLAVQACARAIEKLGSD